MSTLKQLQEKGDEELNKLIPKENDLIFDTYENPLCSTQAILNILHQQTTLAFEAGKAEAIAMVLKEIEIWFLRLHNEPELWTVDQALETLKNKTNS